MSQTIKCENCFHFMLEQQMIVGQKVGSCRRYPPQAQMIGSPQGVQLVSNFPPTQTTHFCGEFKPKENES
jgi:hypothetical protein